LAQFSIETETLALELAQKKELLSQTEKELAQLRDGITRTRESLSQIEISKTKFATDLDHLKSTCYADLGDPLEELVARYEEYLATANSDDLPVIKVMELDEVASDDDELMLNDLAENVTGSFFPAGFELESGKLRLAELKQKIENLGPVNLLALEELGELEQRFIFLVEQKADIETAIADTLAAITEIKNRSREKFVEAFHQINKNFTEMFLELFGGGHGEMRLIDETDVLESGIDIIAQPPGKRLQNVLLLSGGEKAMAAMALVLGIFKYRPSPFCLLDEVDAPLDEVNIGRFADKILEMSSSTQFMIITHSKRTMEAAKTLYGVTMEDPGISKLISVKLT
jgi:chromosome segregation protein